MDEMCLVQLTMVSCVDILALHSFQWSKKNICTQRLTVYICFDKTQLFVFEHRVSCILQLFSKFDHVLNGYMSQNDNDTCVKKDRHWSNIIGDNTTQPLTNECYIDWYNHI